MKLKKLSTMKQKRVSFEVAKAIRKAGYPQDYKNAEDTYTNLDGGIWVKPTYLEVWLWLWREKKSCIGILFDDGNCAVEIWQNKSFIRDFESKFDPEESIIAAIDYICENNLIK